MIKSARLIAAISIFAATVGLAEPAAGAARVVVPVPAGINSVCPTTTSNGWPNKPDATQAINNWIRDYSDPNTTLTFGINACYRIDGTITVTGKSDVQFDGRGSKFQRVVDLVPSPGVTLLPMWTITNSTDIGLFNLLAKGTNTSTSLDATRENNHAFALYRVNGASFSDVDVTGVFGDGIYLGEKNGYPTTNVHITLGTETTIGRNAVGCVNCDGITVDYTTFNGVGYRVFDWELRVGGSGSNTLITHNTILDHTSVQLLTMSSGAGATLSNFEFSYNNDVNGFSDPSPGCQAAVWLTSDPVASNLSFIGNVLTAAGSIFSIEDATGVTINNNTGSIPNPGSCSSQAGLQIKSSGSGTAPVVINNNVFHDYYFLFHNFGTNVIDACGNAIEGVSDLPHAC